MNYKNEFFYNSMLVLGKYLGAGLATIGVVGAGAGIGTIFSGFLIAVSRNMETKDALFPYALLGFALCEAMGLLAIMMAFLLLYS